MMPFLGIREFKILQTSRQVTTFSRTVDLFGGTSRSNFKIFLVSYRMFLLRHDNQYLVPLVS
jgi:hypothetical protein